MSIPLEIERKFLVRRLPLDLCERGGAIIQQGYIVSESDVEVRLRAIDGQYRLTVKRGRGLQREEVELTLSAAQYDQLLPLTEGQRIEKTRHTLHRGHISLVVDVYRGRLKDLIVAEVEFDSVPDSEAFVPPEWFGAELTGDERYKNKNLALHGLPSPPP